MSTEETTGSIWTADFWKATAERVIRTFAQAFAAAFVANATGIIGANWEAIVSISGGAALVALMTCIAANITTHEGPGFTKSENLH